MEITLASGLPALRQLFQRSLILLVGIAGIQGGIFNADFNAAAQMQDPLAPESEVSQDQKMPLDVQSMKIKSSMDGFLQDAIYFLPPPEAEYPCPLLVVLHTWSGDYEQRGFVEPCLEACRNRGWAMVHPDFRGPNQRPEACASDLAVQDVLDAVSAMQAKTRIDRRRIYLVGTSGGGHMSLIMAARAPEIWAGVSAWVPVTDLIAWHEETKTMRDARYRRYSSNVEACCGGAPGASGEIDAQYKARSPLSLLPAAKGLPIDINVGITDGHTGSVPVHHGLQAFNVLAEANGTQERSIDRRQIEFMTQNQQIPEELQAELVVEPEREHAVLFRRTAGPARITVFDGGHEGDMPTAIHWLNAQKKPSSR